jgi:3-phytase
MQSRNDRVQQTDSVAYALLETVPVISPEGEDAADDPAIWINLQDPGNSLIIGTHKKAGLYVYTLEGKELAFYPVGNVNNVDIRYGFTLGDGTRVDLIGASNRSDNSIVLMTIDPETYVLYDILEQKTYSALSEVYGFSFYHNKSANRYYAFVVAKDGAGEQWEVTAGENNLVRLTRVRSFSFESQTEGLVADDELGYLYAAEEGHCIWKIPADPDKEALKVKIALSDSLNPNIVYDLEGLAIYYGKEPYQGYLLASVQGNNSYALFERKEENRYLGSFYIGTDITDGTEDTDGLEVTSSALGSMYPNGILVVQDGYNYEGDSLATQNFKIIPWERIAGLFNPALLAD